MTMAYLPMSATRTLDEVLDTLDLPGDGQVDKKRIVLMPGRWAKFDPFLMMAEDWFTEPGFEWHPHRGMETVTFVLSGRQRHGDSTGVSSVLEAGDAQWMTAGRGIIHQELAEGSEQVHSLQLWVNLPAARKRTDPRFQDLRRAALPSSVNGGARVTTYAGPGAATTVNSPLSLFHVEMEKGARTVLEVDPAWRSVLYVLQGSIEAGGTAVPEGKVGLSHPTTTSALALSARENAKVLVFSGLPLREPVAHRGPFVMNTAAELDEAMDDYRLGRLAPFPR
jgi:redox-sensitive bicupin YhaK (pirin superfamily)